MPPKTIRRTKTQNVQVQYHPNEGTTVAFENPANNTKEEFFAKGNLKIVDKTKFKESSQAGSENVLLRSRQCPGCQIQNLKNEYNHEECLKQMFTRYIEEQTLIAMFQLHAFDKEIVLTCESCDFKCKVRPREITSEPANQ